MRTENKRTDRQTDREQTENSKPEATLIPVDSRGEWANYNHKNFTCTWYFYQFYL